VGTWTYICPQGLENFKKIYLVHIEIILHCRYNLKAYCYEFDEKYII